MADINSSLPVRDDADGSASGGTAASVSELVGGVHNSTPPTLTNGQQAALQLDSNGRLIVSPSTTSVISRNEPNQQIVNGNAFSLQSTSLLMGQVESNGVYIKNNSATKTAYIFSLTLVQDPTNANNWGLFKVYYNPTVTVNGTAVTPINLLAGSAITTSCNLYTAPTTTARGSLILVVTSGINNAASPSQFPVFPNYFVLSPSQSLLITGTSKGNNEGFYTNMMWFEV